MEPRRFFMARGIVFAVIIVIGLLVAGFYWLNEYIYQEKQADLAVGPQDLEFVIGNEQVKLEDGVHRATAAPESSLMITTQYFGNEARGDLDGDGDEDIVFLITQDGGGSGIFFYLVGAINQGEGYQGTRAVLIGDRISPQTTEFRDGQVIVNYADRSPGEPMTAQPSVGKSLYLKYDPVAMSFGGVVQDFEGEANPDMMSLFMKSWTWVETRGAGNAAVKPKQALAFTLDLFNTGEFSATTDCNRIAGAATEEGDDGLVFSEMLSTKMYCEGSQESEFAEMLGDARTYRFTSRGEFVLTLADGREMLFR
jgi:heat shock protein HslJ